MNKNRDPKEIAEAILTRSICSVQVGACIVTANGNVHSWGWNSSGSGFGEHAEAAAIRRANKKRLKGATIYVSSRRQRNSKLITSAPCPECGALIKRAGIKVVWWNSYVGWIRWDL